MARDWIDHGVRQMRELERQHRRAAERRLHEAAVIKEKGPDLMRRLVAEVGAVVDEYKRSVGPRGASAVEFDALPREAFCVTRAGVPTIALECRPDYEAHVVYCNRIRAENEESDTRELVFSLDMTVGDSDQIALRYEAAVFHTAEEAVEFLLKPVLFPALDQDQ